MFFQEEKLWNAKKKKTSRDVIAVMIPVSVKGYAANASVTI